MASDLSVWYLLVLFHIPLLLLLCSYSIARNPYTYVPDFTFTYISYIYYYIPSRCRPGTLLSLMMVLLRAAVGRVRFCR
jgi:hypothetical protein